MQPAFLKEKHITEAVPFFQESTPFFAGFLMLELFRELLTSVRWFMVCAHPKKDPDPQTPDPAEFDVPLKSSSITGCWMLV